MRVLRVDPMLPAGTDWSEPRLRAKLPDAEIISLPASGKTALLRALAEHGMRAGGFDRVVLPFRVRFVASPRYLALLLALIVRIPARLVLQDTAGELRRPLRQLAIVLAPFGFPFMSLAAVFVGPYFLVRHLLGRALLSRDIPGDEVVGYGAGKGVGGLVFWHYMANLARTYGVFGLAHTGYAGVPCGLHSWPLATLVLRELGYRRYLLLSIGLSALGLAWLCSQSNAPFVLLLVPAVFASTYYAFNVYVGTWEVLAWGFAVLSWGALSGQLPALSGMLAGAALLAHPGVGMLTALGGGAQLLARPDTLTALAWVIAGGLLSCGWWLWPYRCAGVKLGRAELIRKVWPHALEWNTKNVSHALWYATFAGVSAGLHGASAHTVLAALPLAVHLYNARIKWMFSEYTVYNFALFAGAMHLIDNPHPALLLCYLLMINPPVALLWDKPRGPCPALGFDLTPVRMGATRKRVLQAFEGLHGGRIGFEVGTNRADPGWDAAAALGYLLSTHPLSAFNVGYAEIGEFHQFERAARYLNAGASREQLEDACREAGLKYLVAFSPQFRQQLTAWGCTPLRQATGLSFSPIPGGPHTDLTVFDLPFSAELVEPAAPLDLQPNRLTLEVRGGVPYRLKLTYFDGWRAAQHGKALAIEDARPGMLIVPQDDGVVVMEYGLMNYYRRRGPRRRTA